ncbi:hypothetical protein BDV28DRAFT_146052 [Aspergillus coremiiformis]|uniref:RING-type domain-containing protein n=1 Tax=Aspergillus coremiiformis TaxID=138285 RepID=A0A5N6ZCX1_9EURO|nr:hypothetical protein BDV28DRAFT_146052 [Aspergillus coremiiformis]
MASEVIGVVIGAILLIMWYHRRQAARRASDECMRPGTVARWLAEVARSEDERPYAQDICSICLSTLLASSSHDTLPTSPEPVYLPSSPLESHRDGDRTVLVLNQCNHAFHAICLASWFAYGQYTCPVCQAVYVPS